MAQPIITLRGITKHFNKQEALKNINLEIHDGEFLTLLGPSGCGKTTLLRLLSGFETPDSGDITLRGESITEQPPEERHINMVFQSYALFPHMSVYDNIAFGLQCQHCPPSEIEDRVMTALQRVKLTAFRDRKPDTLSGGQQQRVAMARAIVNEPLVLLLDEPLSALDYHLRKAMRIELKTLQRRLGMTFVFVTHDQEEALSMSDRIVVMNHGVIEQIGAPRDIYEEPNNLFVTEFIGEANIFNTTVDDANSEKIKTEIAGYPFTLANRKDFKTGDRINVIVRPEDIEAWGENEISDTHNMIPGNVSEVIYKGSTVDLVITLHNGQKIAATEFFNDDDENLEYEINEPVYVNWKTGWEVVLPDESKYAV